MLSRPRQSADINFPCFPAVLSAVVIWDYSCVTLLAHLPAAPQNFAPINICMQVRNAQMCSSANVSRTVKADDKTPTKLKTLRRPSKSLSSRALTRKSLHQFSRGTFSLLIAKVESSRTYESDYKDSLSRMPRTTEIAVREAVSASIYIATSVPGDHIDA